MGRYRTIKAFIGCLLFAVLLGIMFSLSFAQENQSAQKPDSDIKFSAFQNQLQTLENEKIELETKLADAQTKLAEANAKLLNVEIDKYKRELKDANDEWLRTWSLWFAGIIGFLVLIMGGAFWFWLRSRADQLIADSVEKSLNGFKEAVDQQNVIKNQIRVLEKEHTISVLENSTDSYLRQEHFHSEQIKALQEEVLLQVFGDETRLLKTKYKAVSVLAARKSPRIVCPVLEFLNSVVDSDFDSNLDFGSDPDWEATIHTRNYLIWLVNFVRRIYTNEAYQGLTKFLNRLLTENPKHKDLFLIDTVLSLAHISTELNMQDSVSILKSAMSHFGHPAQDDLRALAVYFDKLDDPAGIKDILTGHVTSGMPDAEETCLELLQKHDPDFVEKWRAQKAAANTQNEESS